MKGVILPEVCKKFPGDGVRHAGGMHPEFFAKTSIQQLRAMSPRRQLEHSGRLTQPMLLKQGATHYQPISWDEADHRRACRLARRVVLPRAKLLHASGRALE
ncbi:MAG: hypothetical protein R3C01_13160 [Planctomycetaceae bacterium]